MEKTFLYTGAFITGVCLGGVAVLWFFGVVP